MATYGTEYLKSRNRKQVFDLFLEHRVLSRAEIVQKTDMSFPTVSKAVEFLLSRGIVRQAGEDPPGTETPVSLGRKRQMLRLNPRACCAMSLNFEGQYLDMGLVDLSGEVFCQKRLPFDNFQSREANGRLAAQMRQMQKRTPCPVLGVGVGLPANVDAETGRIVSFTEAGTDAPLEIHTLFPGLTDEFRLPFYVENDVNLACLGECVRNKGEKHRGKEEHYNLCYLTLGTGFGAGLMLNGKLWRGAANRAGEIGHMLLCPPGAKAPGLLEKQIGLPALERRFGLNLLREPRLTPAQRELLIAYLAEPLSLSVYNVASLFDLERFILAGYLPELLGPSLLDRVRNAADPLLAEGGRRILLTAPGSADNALIGGAQMVFEKTLLWELTDRAITA